MIEVRIESKPGFKIAGQKTWISGTNNELFGEFWEESNNNGLVEQLKSLRINKQDAVLDSTVFGVSCEDKDPADRSFYFYIAAEIDTIPKGIDLEEYYIPACEWAVFRSMGQLPDALIDAEMYAFLKWLPNSNYLHANAPELELYPPCPDSSNGVIVEFWLPIINKV